MIRKAGENRRSAVPPAGDIVGWEDPRDKPPTFPELGEANITRGVNLPATVVLLVFAPLWASQPGVRRIRDLQGSSFRLTWLTSWRT